MALSYESNNQVKLILCETVKFCNCIHFSYKEDDYENRDLLISEVQLSGHNDGFAWIEGFFSPCQPGVLKI